MMKSTPTPALPRPALFDGYGGSELPLTEYAGLVAIYSSLLAGLLAAATRRGGARFTAGDLFLLTVATHKLSRLIAKDRVTAPFRAPFAKYDEDDGAGEISEDARGEGAQRAIGDLLTCPFCLCPWVALVLGAGLVLLPGPTRLVCGILTAISGAHFLHHTYVALENRKEPA